MTENISKTPTKVILQETIIEINKAIPAGEMDTEKDYSKVATLLINLPLRLETAVDSGSFPSLSMETIKGWAEWVLEAQKEGNEKKGVVQILFPWGHKLTDKNSLEALFDEIYS